MPDNPPKMSLPDYVAASRQKFPDDFKDWDDDQVARGMLARYPGDAEDVEADPRTVFGNRTDALTEFYSRKNGIDPELTRRVIGTESTGKPGATSPKGAQGLMQVMPGTFQTMKQKYSIAGNDPYDLHSNLDAGTHYLREQLDEFGKPDLALAAYNAGPGSVRRYKGIPPFRETKAYVPKILSGYQGTGYAEDFTPQVKAETANPPSVDVTPEQPTFKGGEIIDLPNRATTRRSSPTISVRARTGDTPDTLAQRYNVNASEIRVAGQQIVSASALSPIGDSAPQVTAPTVAQTTPQPGTQAPVVPQQPVSPPATAPLQGATVRPMRRKAGEVVQPPAPQEQVSHEPDAADLRANAVQGASYAQSPNAPQPQIVTVPASGGGMPSQDELSEAVMTKLGYPGLRDKYRAATGRELATPALSASPTATGRSGYDPQTDSYSFQVSPTPADIQALNRAQEMVKPSASMSATTPEENLQSINQASLQRGRDQQINDLLSQRVEEEMQVSTGLTHTQAIAKGQGAEYDTLLGERRTAMMKIYQDALSRHPELNSYDPQTVVDEVSRLAGHEREPSSIIRGAENVLLPIGEGMRSSIGSTVANIGKLGRVARIPGAQDLEQAGQGLTAGAQARDLIDEPTGFASRLGRAGGRSLGALPLTLAKLHEMGVPGMVAEGAASRADEGIGGMLKGAAESAATLYAMEGTGQVLSPLWNGLVWTAAPTAKGVLMDNQDLATALGENVVGGALAGKMSADRISRSLESKGYEPYQVKSEDGRTASVYVNPQGEFYSSQAPTPKVETPIIQVSNQKFGEMTQNGKRGQWAKGQVMTDEEMRAQAADLNQGLNAPRRAGLATMGEQLQAKGVVPPEVNPEQTPETPHYSNSQNRRQRNTKNGNKGQFVEGFKQETTATGGLPPAERAASDQSTDVPIYRDLASGEATANAPGVGLAPDQIGREVRAGAQGNIGVGGGAGQEISVMRADLKGRGYADADIDRMTPQQTQDVLSASPHPIERTTPETGLAVQKETPQLTAAYPQSNTQVKLEFTREPGLIPDRKFQELFPEYNISVRRTRSGFNSATQGVELTFWDQGAARQVKPPADWKQRLGLAEPMFRGQEPVLVNQAPEAATPAEAVGVKQPAEDFYTQIRAENQRDYKRKVELLAGYGELEKERQAKLEQQAFYDPNDSRFQSLDRRLNEIDGALRLQVEQGAKHFGISTHDFVGVVNDYLENSSSVKQRLLPRENTTATAPQTEPPPEISDESRAQQFGQPHIEKSNSFIDNPESQRIIGDIENGKSSIRAESRLKQIAKSSGLEDAHTDEVIKQAKTIAEQKSVSASDRPGAEPSNRSKESTRAATEPAISGRRTAEPSTTESTGAEPAKAGGAGAGDTRRLQSEDVTGGKVDVTRQEREQRGLNPVERQAYLAAGDSYTAGKQEVEAGRIEPRGLAESVADNPRPLSAKETGALIYDRARLKNEQKAIYDDINKAVDAGDERQAAQGRERLQQNEKAFDANDKALELGGREWSMAGQARKTLVKSDYSIAEMVQSYKAETGKEPSPRVRAQIETQSKRIAELEKQIAQHEEQGKRSDAQDGLDRIKDEVAREGRKSRRASTRADLDTEFAQLSTEFSKHLETKLHANPLDPELVKIIGKMAKNRVLAGVNTIEGLVDAVHAQVKDYLDDKRAIRDAISGYGKEKQSRQVEEWQKTLNDLKSQMRDLSKQEDEASGIREKASLKSAKTRLQNSINEYERRIREGDFTPPTRRQVEHDRQSLDLLTQVGRVKEQYENLKQQEIRRQRPLQQKILDTAVKGRRAVALSSSWTLGKLTSAATQRLGITPIEEIEGGFMSVLPGLKTIARQAPSEGGFRPSAESQAIARAWRTYLEVFKPEGEIRQALKTGKTSIDVLYGGKRELPPEALDFIGHLHSALKAPAKLAQWERSMAKNLDWLQKQGKDISDLAVRQWAGARSFVDANRAVLMQENMLSDGFSQMLSYLNNKGALGRVTAAAGRLIFPVTKVAPNFVKETLNYSLGGVNAMTRMTAATKFFGGEGLKNLTPDQADGIMRAFKKQGLGVALFALGVLNRGSIGGYGKRKDEKDVQAGGMRIFGWDVPSWLLHTPPLEVMQMGATYGRTLDAKGTKPEEAGLAAATLKTGVGLAREIPFFEEPMQAGSHLDNYKSASTFAGSMAGSMVTPPDVARAAKAFDPNEPTTTGRKVAQMAGIQPIDAVRRRPQNFGQAVEMGWPGARQNVPVNNLFGTARTPGAVEAQRLNLNVGDSKQGGNESVETFQKRQQEVNPLVNSALDSLLRNRRYGQLSDDDKKEVFSDVVRRVRENDSAQRTAGEPLMNNGKLNRDAPIDVIDNAFKSLAEKHAKMTKPFRNLAERVQQRPVTTRPPQ